MRRRNPVKEPTQNLNNLPLNQFQPGQRIYARFHLGNDHTGCAAARFLSIERGLVWIQFIENDYLSPDWLDWRAMKIRRFPNDLKTRVQAKSIYLWGESPGDRWPRCHWFRDTKTPAE